MEKETKELTAKEIADKKLNSEISADIKAGFLNPFKAGVTYEVFLKAVGQKSITAYCKNNLTKEQIQWLENDIKKIKK